MSKSTERALARNDVPSAQCVNTSLTPNSNAITQATGNPSNLTSVVFQFQDHGTFWTPSVSVSNANAVLSKDVGNGVVTFKAGLAVSYVAMNVDCYNVLLDGEIIDSNSVYNFAGAVLATFFPQDS